MDAYFPLFKAVYPNKEPLYTRDRPMQVLALGISRSGTESLSKALVQLGYEDVYHGMQLVEYRLGEIPQWYRLAKAKQIGDTEFLNKEEFDKVLGHSMAVTDAPCCIFSLELLKAYPDAKVVLNKRLDTAAWERSIRTTLVGRFDRWYSRIPMWFERHEFWTGLLNLRVFEPMMVQPLLQSSEGMAKEYERHYERLREECVNQEREYLDWNPEDGWKPLCRFLGKPVPVGSGPFPCGNTPTDLAKFSINVHRPRMERARANMAIFAVTVLGAVAISLFHAFL